MQKDLQRKQRIDLAEAKDWVVLISGPHRDHAPFTQLGPYSTDQILEKIKTGDIRYSDHAWRPGYKEWTRIGQIETFQSKQEPSLNPRSDLVSVYRNLEADLSKVVQQVRFAASDLTIQESEPQLSPEPVSIVGHDEAQMIPVRREPMADTSWAVTAKPEIRKIPAANPDPILEFVGDTSSAALPPILPPLKGSSQDRFVDRVWSARQLVLIFVLVGAGIFAAYMLPKYVGRFKKSKPKSAAAVTKSIKVVPIFKPGALEIVFETGLPKKSVLQVEVVGESGKIIKAPGLLRRYELVRTGDSFPALKLSDREFPDGVYQVRVQSGKLKSSAEVRKIPNPSDFDFQLANFRTQLVQVQAAQKRDLQDLTRKLSQKAYALEYSHGYLKDDKDAWSVFYDDWQKSLSVHPFDEFRRLDILASQSLAYPVLALQVQNALERMLERAEALNYHVIHKGKNPPKSEIEREFIELLNKAMAL